MAEQSSLALRTTHAIDEVKLVSNIIHMLRTDVLKKDVDYGVIPGTGEKPTLLLPGMEKLMRALNAVPEYIERSVIRDYDRPLFHWEFECRLLDADSGMPIPGGRGLGLCTSAESSFAWRWVKEADLPLGIDTSKLIKRGGSISEFAFAVDKAETSGPYGKTAAYWQSFKDAIANGTARSIKRKTSKGKEMDAWEIDGTVYRLPNPDIFDQINAIMKRAKKRALGDAIKGAASASEFFTVDVEDFVAFDNDVVQGTYTEMTDDEIQGSSQKQQSATSQKSNLIDDSKPWLNAKDIAYLVTHTLKAFGISAGDLVRYIGFDDLTDLSEKGWGKFETAKAAGEAIKTAHEAEQEKLAADKPATTKKQGYKLPELYSKVKHLYPEGGKRMENSIGKLVSEGKLPPALTLDEAVAVVTKHKEGQKQANAKNKSETDKQFADIGKNNPPEESQFKEDEQVYYDPSGYPDNENEFEDVPF